MDEPTRRYWESVNLQRIRQQDPDKLLQVAEELKREVLRPRSPEDAGDSDARRRQQQQHGPPEPGTPSSPPPAFWSGLQWVPAELDFPYDDPTPRFLCLFGSHEIEVLVYNCTTRELKVQSSLEKLEDKKALYSRLPSRRCSRLRVCVQKIPAAEARAAPRWRVTDGPMPRDMTFRHAIALGQLGVADRLKVLLGRIQWIFVLNASREFSSGSGSSSSSAGGWNKSAAAATAFSDRS
ncbi:hypothetical protein F4778DRAFT_596863 [Xylariomycetidae sp. FL2044]|nr:hypothetical protein F4778DRAFT_596863 [Xylariomycetidae sp. FL2044]